MWDNAKYCEFEEHNNRHRRKESQNEVFGAHWIGVSDDGDENIKRKCSNEEGGRS